MRQDDGVRLRVRQIERAAERVTEFMVQRHADSAETDAAQPGAIERFGAGLAIVGLRGNGGQGAGERADAFLPPQRDPSVSFPRIHPSPPLPPPLSPPTPPHTSPP